MFKESLPGTITGLSIVLILWVVRNVWRILTSAPPPYVESNKIIVPETLKKRSSTYCEKLRETIPSDKQSVRSLCGLFAWLMIIRMSVGWFFTYHIFDHVVGWTIIFGSLFFISWAYSGEPHLRPNPNLSKRGQAIAWRVGQFLGMLLIAIVIGGTVYLVYFDPEIQASRQEGARLGIELGRPPDKVSPIGR